MSFVDLELLLSIVAIPLLLAFSRIDLTVGDFANLAVGPKHQLPQPGANCLLLSEARRSASLQTNADKSYPTRAQPIPVCVTCSFLTSQFQFGEFARQRDAERENGFGYVRHECYLGAAQGWEAHPIRPWAFFNGSRT